jgi:hypothetical protein
VTSDHRDFIDKNVLHALKSGTRLVENGGLASRKILANITLPLNAEYFVVRRTIEESGSGAGRSERYETYHPYHQGNSLTKSSVFDPLYNPLLLRSLSIARTGNVIRPQSLIGIDHGVLAAI